MEERGGDTPFAKLVATMRMYAQKHHWTIFIDVE
tara:strand:- start:113978 stop:114079 length:102 start_codon:yes stop_codon:yes gene_type:complete